MLIDSIPIKFKCFLTTLSYVLVFGCMIPLPVNSKVVILLNPEGKVEAIATNVDRDINVTVTSDPAVYREAALGQPFNSKVPVQPTQVLAMRKK